MSTRDPIRFAEAGVLRAQFKDAANDPFQASGVEVNLYAPDDDPGTDLPTLSGIAPTYLGEGVFEVTVTGMSPGGIWTDEWRGYIMGSLTTAELNFTVLDAGSVVQYPPFGVCENNLIEVTLSSGIASVDGVTLSSDESFFFTTTYSPMYADARKVRLEAGGVMGSLDDYTVYQALLEASLEADALTFSTTTNDKVFKHARREYTACKAAQILVNNILANGGVLKSKKLADFAVEYDTNALRDLLDAMHDKCRKWEAQVQTGGRARAIRDPKMVIKGELDPDRPPVGRLWLEPNRQSRPFGNTDVKRRNYRRWRKGNRKTYKDEW